MDRNLLVSVKIRPLPSASVLSSGRSVYWGLTRYRRDSEPRTMISGARQAKHSGITHWVHVVSALFMLSYIAFDVLDLDLSDFILNHVPHQTSPAIAEAVKVPQLSDPAKTSAQRIVSSLSAGPISRDALGNDSSKIVSSQRFGVIFHRRIIPPRSSNASPPH
jgi:hypothetical protein